MSTEIDQIVAYTKQFIAAATPIVKQAYEIGLLTLRIDAISTIVPSVAVLIAAFFAIRKIIADLDGARKAQKEGSNRYLDASDYLPGMGVLHLFGGIIAVAAGIISICILMNVWLYVKLFAPELWLAHMAIEKIAG